MRGQNSFSVQMQGWQLQSLMIKKVKGTDNLFSAGLNIQSLCPVFIGGGNVIKKKILED